MSHKKKTISPCALRTLMSMSKPQCADESEGDPLLPVDASSPQGRRDLLACDTHRCHSKRKLDISRACVQWMPHHLGPLKGSTSLLIPCLPSWANPSLRVSRGRNPGLCTIGLPSICSNMDI